MILRNTDMLTFSQLCVGKKIACYGIGEEFFRIIANYADYEWQSNIGYLVDSDMGKAGKFIFVNGRKLRIILPETLLEKDVDEIVILVTSMACYEIVERLNRIKKLDKVCCYLFNFMFSVPENRKIMIRQTDEARIPPIIHYCWFGGKKKSDLNKRCMESWQKYCSGYEIREWNESNCDIGETLYTKQAYETGKYGFVPDYFRLKILRENGGIYLDTDVELVKSLDDLRYNEAFCGLSFPGEVGLGLGFGSVKGNPLMQYLAKRYSEMSFIREDGTLDETGSPVYQTRDLLQIGMRNGNILQTVEGMTIYPTEVLSPKNVCTGKVDVSSYTYAIHHYDASWFDGERARKKRENQLRCRRIEQMFKTIQE